MARKTYKKYMKKDTAKDYSLLKVFIFSFFGMLLVFTFLIKSFSPSVDVSIGDYKQESEIENIEDVKKNVDNRLAMIQDEDQGKNFSDLIKKAPDYEEEKSEPIPAEKVDNSYQNEELTTEANVQPQSLDPVYKVFIGSYTSAEQAKVAKDIITEAGTALTPIVKCIGTNNYTLQVGIFKNKNSADALLYTIQKNNLPGRIVQEY